MILSMHLQVVICVSALKCLFDNWPPNLTRSFEIPVTVRVFEGGSTVIFIDKPLPAKGLTLTEKNEWFHKLGSVHIITHSAILQ